MAARVTRIPPSAGITRCRFEGSAAGRVVRVPPSQPGVPRAPRGCCRVETTASLRAEQGDRRSADGRGETEVLGIDEGDDVAGVGRVPGAPAVVGDEPVTAALVRAFHAVHRLVEAEAAGRAVEARPAVREDAAVAPEQPVAAPARDRLTTGERRVQPDVARIAEEPRVA